MRIRCLACEALGRAVYHAAARSPHTVDVELMRLGLHNDPAELRAILQGAIDATDAQQYDTTVLVYGLCGKATHRLRAGAVPLVIPRAHDCITLLLGSRERYERLFADNPGTYWYSADYLERGGRDAGKTLSLGNADSDEIQKIRAHFVATYGEENADYLMEAMGAWSTHYTRAAFIAMGLGDEGVTEALARGDAQRRDWTFERLEGDPGLIVRLLSGEWNDDFLVVRPGRAIVESFDTSVVKDTVVENVQSTSEDDNMKDAG